MIYTKNVLNKVYSIDIIHQFKLKNLYFEPMNVITKTI